MANPYFQFKQFTVYHDHCAMKVTTDACLFGAWCAREITESMVNSQLSLTNKISPSMVDSRQLLDIGTGSGLLSLMVAQKNKVFIDAVEIDEEAADQAARNVKDSPFATTIAVTNSNILNWRKRGYDIIIANPPFYENEIPSAQQQKNIAHHGEGLQLKMLFSIIKDKLADKGNFYLLLPYKRKTVIEQLLQQAGLYLEIEVIVQPSVTHLPFRLLVKGSKIATAVRRETLSIYTAEKQYTTEFVALLKDYYLYL